MTNGQERICNILRDNEPIREKVNNLIYQGRRDNKEYGFKFCLNDQVSTTEVCKGGQCEVKVEAECPVGTKEEVSFHVHPPRFDYLPSGSDYIEVTKAGDKNFCIGYTQESVRNFVSCYKVPDEVKYALNALEYTTKNLNKSASRRTLQEAERRRTHAYLDVFDIENMGSGERMDFAQKSRICRTGVSFRK